MGSLNSIIKLSSGDLANDRLFVTPWTVTLRTAGPFPAYDKDWTARLTR